MRHIAIIGLGSGMEYAPKDMERWGLPWGGDSSLDMYFEMHDKTIRPFTDEYRKKLRGLEVPIIMQEEWDDIPNSHAFPADILDEINGYVESSIGYMLAYAIRVSDQIDEISIYGVGAPFDEHYVYQRANLEYLIGVANGLGIKVHIHENSELMTSFWDSGIYGFDQDNLRPGTEYVQ